MQKQTLFDSERDDGHPHMQSKLREHLQQTHHHADLIKGCIERHGEKVLAVKSGMGALSGIVQGIAPSMASDTLVKNALADYAAEHFEIASYRSLIDAARFLGDDETANICQQILRDEEDMARWIEQQIPVVTREFLGDKTREMGKA